MTQLRAIIVDDEKPARRRLRELLEKQPDIASVKECVKAFEVSALDYLLKPFSDERFERSLARALSFVRTQQREELNQKSKPVSVSRSETIHLVLLIRPFATPRRVPHHFDCP
jgi:DNA-binding LytR/AlgR family response regulator